MIANITPTARSRSLYGALEYNKLKLDNGEAKAIFANNIIVPRNELDRLKLPYLQRCFQPYLDQNRRTKATVFHCSLNPHPNDRLDEQQLRIMAREYMEQLGYGEQPYVVYLHKDIDREHLHIVSLRVKLDGTAISSSNERRRSKAITAETRHRQPESDRLQTGRPEATNGIHRAYNSGEVPIRVGTGTEYAVCAVQPFGDGADR